MPFIADLMNIKNAIKLTGGNPQSPQPWLQKLFGTTVTSSGMAVDEDTALKYSAVWAAVNIISGAIGSLPLLTYQRVGEGKERAATHGVYSLLRTRPNPFMDAATLRETLQAHVMLWGNGYAEIELNGAGRPIALWPLLPNKVVPDIEDGKVIYKIQTDTGEVKLPYSQVLHIKGLGFDGIKGYSVIQYAAENMALGLAAEKNAASFYGNDSSPMGILTTESSLKADTKDEIEKQWEKKHKGLDRRYRVAILHSGLKFQSVGIPAKDAQLLESRKHGISDIARWFNIPPHMLADLDKATFSNIEEQGIDFVRWTLNRWLTKWTMECDFKLFLLPERSRFYTEFLTEALLRGNTESRYKAYQIGLGGNNNPGFITINEVRSKENLPPVPRGDELFMPSYGGGGDSSFSALLNTAWKRIANKEVGAVRKAIKKPSEFVQWVDDFYAKHQDFALSILGPIYAAEHKESVEADIAGYIEKRKAELKAAFESENVNALLEEWESDNQGACYE